MILKLNGLNTCSKYFVFLLQMRRGESKRRCIQFRNPIFVINRKLVSLYSTFVSTIFFRNTSYCDVKGSVIPQGRHQKLTATNISNDRNNNAMTLMKENSIRDKARSRETNGKTTTTTMKSQNNKTKIGSERE